MKLPDPKNKIEIFADGNDDYSYVLKNYYSNMNYGQLIKIRKNGIVVEKIKQIVYGAPEIEEIETTDVENFNGILREKIGRLVRKSKCFSKRKERENAIELLEFISERNKSSNARRYNR